VKWIDLEAAAKRSGMSIGSIRRLLEYARELYLKPRKLKVSICHPVGMPHASTPPRNAARIASVFGSMGSTCQPTIFRPRSVHS
jgi:hypothetical protein